MLSCIPTLSLLVLVLANHCFTLPILNEQLSNSTVDASINNAVTDGDTLNLRLLTDDATSMLPAPQKKESIDEHMGFELTTDVQVPRSIDEYSTLEPVVSSTEKPIHKKRHHHHHLSLTTIESMTSSTEESLPDKREDENSMQSTTEQSSSDGNDHDESSSSSSSSSEPSPDKRENEEVTSESMMLFTESSDSNEDKYQHLSVTTMNPSAQVAEVGRRGFVDDIENGTSHMEVELTTTNKIPFTSSSMMPETSTSTNSKTVDRKVPSARKLNRNSTEKAKEENSEDSSIPTAIIDQKALDKLANIPNDFLFLDENADLIVTGFPEMTSPSSTTMVYKEKEALNQGSTLVLFLLAALLFCACVMASTLAFVKNRHTLKRKSRITEMEAFLDDHYANHPHPFLFAQQQQQHHK